MQKSSATLPKAGFNPFQEKNMADVLQEHFQNLNISKANLNGSNDPKMFVTAEGFGKPSVPSNKEVSVDRERGVEGKRGGGR